MKRANDVFAVVVCAAALTAQASLQPAQKPPLLPELTVAALAAELSGETAKRNLEYLARLHRMRGSRGFRAAAEHVAAQARAYGLQDVQMLQFPADGKTMFGTQKSRLAWDADFAELWEMRDGKPETRLASWSAMPITLAQDSESADVTADLVDVGDGTSEKDYAGKNVRGKIVLAAQQPGSVARLAVEKYGAVGIVSYALNQPTAWRGDDDSLIRWGHLESFSKIKTFGFMVSLKTAWALQRRMLAGETIRMHAKVQAGQHPGTYDIVTGIIPGADPQLKNDEIVFSCHLDHQLPGANDNASGCVTILEIARTLTKLITEGKTARPARTMRFVWPPEIEGTVILLNGKPDLAARIKAAIHLDMVGGGPVTKAIFHVTRGPASLPSFVNTVAQVFGEFVNERSAQYASTGRAAYPMLSLEGGKEALQADFADFSAGSDHQIYTDGSFRIPAIYLNDWPDRYIHTNMDSPANIDPTKLKRAGFIAAASGYFLAGMKTEDAGATWTAIKAQSLRRARAEAGELVASMERFIRVPDSVRQDAAAFDVDLQKLIGPPARRGATTLDGGLIFRRNPRIKGPMSVFGYDYFTDHYGEEKARGLRIFSYRGQYDYECLNFVDGRRMAQDIRDELSAVYGPIPLDVVVEYLKALESIAVIQLVK